LIQQLATSESSSVDLHVHLVIKMLPSAQLTVRPLCAVCSNQPQVGNAVRNAVAAGMNRSDIFVTTKIAPAGRDGTGSCTATATVAAIKADVTALDVGPLDLVLLHFPCSTNAGNQAVWQGLVDAKKLGLTRSIGVSHFTHAQLDSIISLGKGVPSVNQCALSIGNHDDATIKYCKAKGITYEGFSVLKNVDLKDKRLAVRAEIRTTVYVLLRA
jgi:2,5-diketo-D-gluconate reductase A